MNKSEANSILRERLLAFARQPYSDLVQRVDGTETATVQAPFGAEYQL